MALARALILNPDILLLHHQAPDRGKELFVTFPSSGTLVIPS